MSFGTESYGITTYGQISTEAVISASISGTCVPSSSEAQIVFGGRTIIITLSNDNWVAAGATFDAQRQNIINGLTSAQSELTGWNNEVRDNEAVTSVVRTSDTIVTITLSASVSYNITATETITVTIPSTALVTSASAIVGLPTFQVITDTIAAIPVFMKHYRNMRT